MVDVLELLHESEDNYALDILSIVESILEDPKVILEAQERKLKNDKFAELKAQGAEYEERVEELDKIVLEKAEHGEYAVVKELEEIGIRKGDI